MADVLAQLGLELDRGLSYRIAVPDAAREAIVARLVETAGAAVVSPGGDLIGNLKVWENLALPVAWRGIRDRALEARAQGLLAELGFEGDRLSALCGAMPEALSPFELRAIAFTRAMLVAPEVIVFDRLFEGLARNDRERATRFERLFHLAFPFRTSVFVDSEPLMHARHAAGKDLDLREAGLEARAGAPS
jgi:predicted ABC-type transport system involved in lysophospholipase L1 biosynthesis ATPase subunit